MIAINRILAACILISGMGISAGATYLATVRLTATATAVCPPPRPERGIGFHFSPLPADTGNPRY